MAGQVVHAGYYGRVHRKGQEPKMWTEEQLYNKMRPHYKVKNPEELEEKLHEYVSLEQFDPDLHRMNEVRRGFATFRKRKPRAGRPLTIEAREKLQNGLALFRNAWKERKQEIESHYQTAWKRLTPAIKRDLYK